MNKNILLVMGVIILLLTAVGVFMASSYKTKVTVVEIPNSGNLQTLKIKVLVNYGPLGGGSKPLPDAVIWIYNSSGFVTQNFTDSQGVAVFKLPPGKYEILVTALHFSYTVDLSTSKEVTIDYAYLYSS